MSGCPLARPTDTLCRDPEETPSTETLHPAVQYCGGRWSFRKSCAETQRPRFSPCFGQSAGGAECGLLPDLRSPSWNTAFWSSS